MNSNLNEIPRTRVLIFGASGMLGSNLFRFLSRDKNLIVSGTVRNEAVKNLFTDALIGKLICNININTESDVQRAFAIAKPDIVINCVGIIKQLPASKDYVASLLCNSVFPHRLAHYSNKLGARLIHFSTDCVFSGHKEGLYTENDYPDAQDLYGRTKFLGELHNSDALTLRTSIIGHELESKNSLISWFLSQPNSVKGFTKAIFSGLPSVEIGRIIKDYILPNSNLKGLYHLSVSPISKYDLLRLVGKIYHKSTDIIPDGSVSINRALNSEKFQIATGFRPRPWPDLIWAMNQDYECTINN